MSALVDSVESMQETLSSIPIFMATSVGLALFVSFLFQFREYSENGKEKPSFLLLFVSISLLTVPHFIDLIFNTEVKDGENEKTLNFSYLIYFIIGIFGIFTTYFTSKIGFLYFKAKNIIKKNKKIINLEESFYTAVNNISAIDNQLLENNLFLSNNKLLNKDISELNEKLKIKLFNFNNILEKY